MWPSEFKKWREHMGLTKTKAGEFLGISPRTIDLYEIGTRHGKPVLIPRTVELACAALAAGIRSYNGPV